MEPQNGLPRLTRAVFRRTLPPVTPAGAGLVRGGATEEGEPEAERSGGGQLRSGYPSATSSPTAGCAPTER
jgi:hypothetical protein